MKIEFEGKNVEAYKLMMLKENALEILSGKKTVEIRAFSEYYTNLFLDKKIRDKQNREREDGKEVDIQDAINPIQFVRFTNYNKSWYLDVHLSELGIALMAEDDIKELAEDFSFHEFDDEWQQYAELPDEEKPLFFLLAIDKVIGHSGL